MFRRRNSGELRRALARSQDPVLAALYDELADRRERVAELELELFEARSELATFQAEVESRLGGLRERVEQLERELRQARRAADLRAQWGQRAESGDIPYDVLGQYERTWRRTAPASAEAKKPLDDASKDEIKRLYRSLAKRFHPDLTVDPTEKGYREKLMAQVNAAYADGNMAKLRKLADQPDHKPEERQRSRDEIAADLRAEIRRLDGVIHRLRSSIDELTRSRDVELMLEATMARRQGHDLIGQLAADLRRQIADMEAELARIG
jgi:predicted  nucleic acid-binding Zn-ribbon protein